MAYEAHKWKIGEEITSEKLNHIEKGIEEAGLPREITDPQDGQILKYDAASGKWVNAEGGSGSSTLVVNDNNGTLDKTWQEISDAYPNVYISESISGSIMKMPVVYVQGSGAGYFIYSTYNDVGDQSFKSDIYRATTPEGYPAKDGGIG